MTMSKPVKSKTGRASRIAHQRLVRTPKFQAMYQFGKCDCPRWAEPKMARLPKAPKWLRRYKLYTHRYLSSEMGKFNLTEMRTGLAVIQACTSRKSAIKQGMARIITAGRKKFQSAVKYCEAKSPNIALGS
jgi:hypothetical protein